MSDNIKIVPNVPNWNSNGDVIDLEFLNRLDYKDLDKLNQALIKTATALNQLNKKLSKWERAQAKYEVEYRQKYRKSIIESQLKTDSQKKLYAQAECEDLEMKNIYSKQIIGELKRNTNTLRMDLDIIQTIGNNIRREMTL